MKSERQKRILELIRYQQIEKQEDLANLLAKEGFAVTQATVSRDIRQLNLQKETDEATGKTCYKAASVYNTEVPEHFKRVLKEGFLKAEVAMNILVIKTVSGMAMAVAAALDAYQFPEIVGCIAGDDTIMCAISSTKAAETLKKKIMRIAED